MVLKRLPYAFVLASFMITCSKKDSDKRHNTVTPPPASQSCSALADGQSTTLTYYKKAKASWSETCASLALQVNGTCDKGKLLIQGEGVPTCDETLLQKLNIKAESTTLIVNGAPLLLTLEGVDQDGQAFVIDSSQATWSSSSNVVAVSTDGHVTATDAATDVVIQATVKDAVAEVKINAKVPTPDLVYKSCDEIKHGDVKEFPRFKQAIVNFQSTCESYQAQARCEDGSFVFKPEDSVTECRVATLAELSVSPQVLALKASESRPLTVEATDETGFKGTLNWSDLTWTVEASAADQDKITVADGAVTLKADLVEDALLKVQYQDLTQTIPLTKANIDATRISFEKSAYLLKSGDVLDLKVLGFAADKPVAIDPTKLVLESSNPEKVVIENQQAKVLSPGSSVTITAKYAGETLNAQTQLNIEDELKLVSVGSKNDVLIAEKPWVVAVAQLKLEGPALEQKPRVVSKNETCSFSLYLSRGQWMIDVKLEVAGNVEIPASCQAEVAADSAAGQKVAQNLNVPVRYVAIDFKEFMLKDATKPGNVIAALTYKLSSNVKLSDVAVTAHKISSLTPTQCKLSAEQKEAGIEVLADVSAAPEVPFCAGFLTFSLETEGRKQVMREQLSVSPFRPFRATCEDRSNGAIQLTIKAISDALSIRNDCQLVETLLRKKNSESIFRNAPFALSMASKNLSNLEPLARLTGLRELVLTDNPALTDLRPVASLKGLKRIDVDFTGVTDFSPLYKLDAMELFYSDAETIDCKKSEVTNIPLKNLCTQE